MRLMRAIVVFVASLATAAAAVEPTVVVTPHDNAFKQGDGAADRAITAEVRSRLAADPALSESGRHVEIMTDDGVVYLRGPVDSAGEKASIEATAKSVAGVKQVTSLLAITAH
jgi:osmotically-inducible protein OsmY